MGLNFYFRFADCKKSKKVSFEHYKELFEIAENIDAIVKVTFHRFGRTLFVS